jgi:hypothetical protein
MRIVFRCLAIDLAQQRSRLRELRKSDASHLDPMKDGADRRRSGDDPTQVSTSVRLRAVIRGRVLHAEEPRKLGQSSKQQSVVHRPVTCSIGGDRADPESLAQISDRLHDTFRIFLHGHRDHRTDVELSLIGDAADHRHRSGNCTPAPIDPRQHSGAQMRVNVRQSHGHWAPCTAGLDLFARHDVITQGCGSQLTSKRGQNMHRPRGAGGPAREPRQGALSSALCGQGSRRRFETE